MGKLNLTKGIMFVSIFWAFLGMMQLIYNNFSSATLALILASLIFMIGQLNILIGLLIKGRIKFR